MFKVHICVCRRIISAVFRHSCTYQEKIRRDYAIKVLKKNTQTSQIDVINDKTIQYNCLHGRIWRIPYWTIEQWACWEVEFWATEVEFRWTIATCFLISPEFSHRIQLFSWSVHRWFFSHIRHNRNSNTTSFTELQCSSFKTCLPREMGEENIYDKNSRTTKRCLTSVAATTNDRFECKQRKISISSRL